MKSQRPKVMVLMGPTACGKTDLAMAIAKQAPVSLVSVDSALIYKGMDIGTAKPTLSELQTAPHALVNILDPSQTYSAADFRTDAMVEMDAIIAQGRTPLLVGGTMLYFKALIDGISALPSGDASLREVIESQAKELGWQTLHDELSSFDPISAARIHPNDPQRLMRAIEVYRLTGKTLTELTAIKPQPAPYEFVQFGLIPEDRDMLHQRIEQRFHRMLELGFEDEVRSLMAQGDLHLGMPSMRCVGYRQMWEYLEGILSFDEMVFRGIVATRQLAKRQLTWLKGWANLSRFKSPTQDIEKIMLNSLK